MAKQTLNQGRRWYVLHTCYRAVMTSECHHQDCEESISCLRSDFQFLSADWTQIKSRSKRSRGKRNIPSYVWWEWICDAINPGMLSRRTRRNVTRFIGTGTTPIRFWRRNNILQKRMGLTNRNSKLHFRWLPGRNHEGLSKIWKKQYQYRWRKRPQSKFSNMFGAETRLNSTFYKLEEY